MKLVYILEFCYSIIIIRNCVRSVWSSITHTHTHTHKDKGLAIEFIRKCKVILNFVQTWVLEIYAETYYKTSDMAITECLGDHFLFFNLRK